MDRWRARLSELLRQWRLAQAETRQARRRLHDRRDAEHEKRLRAGIKDNRAGPM